jgi:hypothetical protein
LITRSTTSRPTARLDGIICAEEIAELEAKVASGDEDGDHAEYLEKARRELAQQKAAIVELEELYKEAIAGWVDIACHTFTIPRPSPSTTGDIPRIGATTTPGLSPTSREMW